MSQDLESLAGFDGLLGEADRHLVVTVAYSGGLGIVEVSEF
jgi:hypothetical protein